MLPAGRDKVCLTACVVSAVINIVLNFILIPRFGMNVAAITTAVAELVGVVISVRYIDKNIRIEGFVDMIKAPLVGTMEIVVIGLIVSHLIHSYFTVALVTIMLSGISYLATMILMKYEFVLSFLKPVLERIKRR